MTIQEIINKWEQELVLYDKSLKGLHPQFDQNQHIHDSASRDQLERCLIDIKQLSEETRKDFEKENCVTLNGEIYKQIKANDNPEKPHHH